MMALYATLGITGFACALCVAAYRRNQLPREGEAPFAIGGGADLLQFHNDGDTL